VSLLEVAECCGPAGIFRWTFRSPETQGKTLSLVSMTRAMASSTASSSALAPWPVYGNNRPPSGLISAGDLNSPSRLGCGPNSSPLSDPACSPVCYDASVRGSKPTDSCDRLGVISTRNTITRFCQFSEHFGLTRLNVKTGILASSIATASAMGPVQGLTPDGSRDRAVLTPKGHISAGMPAPPPASEP